MTESSGERDPYAAINVSSPPAWWVDKSARYTNAFAAARMRLPLTDHASRVFEWLVAQCLGTGTRAAAGAPGRKGEAFVPRGQVSFFEPNVTRDTGVERHQVGKALTVLATAKIIQIVHKGHPAYRGRAAEPTLVRFEADPSRWWTYELDVKREVRARWKGRVLAGAREDKRRRAVEEGGNGVVPAR
jgi:hypothetical protein